MTTVLHSPPLAEAAPRSRTDVPERRIALLGLGRVGSAIADLLEDDAPGALAHARIAGALVRRTRDRSLRPFPTYTSGAAVLDEQPDVVVEALGGIEPARTLVLEALGRGIPVVTANKTLLAVCGDELFAAARRGGVPLRYEASVIAGVPFLGTFDRRPLAARIDGLTGILNGTSNYILSRLEDGLTLSGALRDAKEKGYAEPDASKDLDGSDAAEKLAILIRAFAKLSVQPADIPRTSIDSITPHDLARARDLGGRLKPVASARWAGDRVSCFAGPAFLPPGDLLGNLDGVLNGVRLERRGGASLHFTGPGAGPEITARTVLDDVVDVLGGGGTQQPEETRPGRPGGPADAGSFVTFRGAHLPDGADVADLLGAHGVWVERWGARRPEPGGVAQSALTFPCEALRLERAVRAVAAASGCSTTAFPVVGSAHD